MKSILQKYELLFRTRNNVEPICDVSNSISDNYIIAEFLDDYQRVADVEEYILDIIDIVDGGSIEEGETAAQNGIHVYITKRKTKFIRFHGCGTYLDPDLTIETPDFRVIVTLWREFVEQTAKRLRKI